MHCTLLLNYISISVEVSDIVNPILFLLSDESAMINGAILPIDGGFTAC